MRRTKIVCTIGPASQDAHILSKLIEAGMNVARLNFSHGTHEEHAKRIETIREAAQRARKPIAILLDIKGPKIRTHTFENGQAQLRVGETVTITMKEIVGTASRFSVSYEGLYEDVAVGSRLLIDDGLMELEVMKKQNEELETKVIHGGIIKDHKGVNVPNVTIRLPGITEKDIKDIVFGIEQDIDYIAASFVRKAEDVLEIKELLQKHNASHIKVIPKIENQEGIDNIDAILDVADGIMVARGDMGIEVAAEEVPLVQKMIIKKCNVAGKPVITATQMLDSMQRNPRPTRAEASDVANAVFDGTDAIMLSGETAAGQYPIESVQTMHRIAARVEQSLKYEELQKERIRQQKLEITEVIGKAAAYAALNLDVQAILTPTESGHTAKMIAKYRPKAPIIAVTFDTRIYRQLALIWGVQSLQGTFFDATDELLTHAVSIATEEGLLQSNDHIIITAGIPVGKTGATNMLKIQIVE